MQPSWAYIPLGARGGNGLGRRKHQGLEFYEELEIMVIPLRRMTPGYIRLLQTQAAGKIVINPSDTLLQRAAVLLGMFGVSISSYSTHQLTQKKRLPLRL
nr:uncharacterized protein LOC110361972 isoform X2 [Columba livia]